MIDAATITDNALDEWSAWLRSARQGRSLREWGILASDLVTAIQYLSEAHPEVPSVTKGDRWSDAGRAGRRKQQQQEYPSVLGMLAYLKEALRCVDSFNKAPTGYNSLLLGPPALVLERPASASAADEAESWKYITATMAARVQRLLDKKRVKNQAVTEMTAVYLQTAKSAPRPRPVVQSPTTPAESGDSSGSDSSEISGVSGESRLEGEGVAEAIGVIRSCQDKGESLWTPGVVCRLFGTPELPHKVFPEAAKAMAEQAAAAPEATAIDPTAAAAFTDTAAGAAVVPPTPGTEPKSPHSLPSVIFRPGRLIEKTLMIEAADGSLVPAPPAIPPRHPLPQPPPAPLNQGSPNLGQTRAIQSDGSITVRAPVRLYNDLFELAGRPKVKATPGPSGQDDMFATDAAEELNPREATAYRTMLGKVLYMSNERPDAQAVIQNLSSRAAKPTAKAMKLIKHLVGYLWGTQGYGVNLCLAPGKSVMNFARGKLTPDEPITEHLVEGYSDSNFANDRTTRKSLSSGQIYIDQALMYSFVRGQKVVTLSSGEAELVALTQATSDEAILVHKAWVWTTQEEAKLVMRSLRSDSSVARAIASRLGVGRVRHLQTSCLWIQQWVAAKTLRVAAVPTQFNPSDMGTKSLQQRRLRMLCFLAGMVDDHGNHIGQEEHAEVLGRESEMFWDVLAAAFW
ncbi:Retrovirus-related Pol polyprotein from transposon TNT 1-94 [Symbiodinium microadriaticum]|uniref:Retrovirus-related Pol polyprotein from transposon TNT 1-94 n=1 Tax=Symbiodinium microadriaticum TaxID=2951 RepID=A0A1Q9BU91_SYMMI|nr:Retrovirus-related Pol polyprotein from transposon TNT 1-94 [Symbiodinium microadriaticum]